MEITIKVGMIAIKRNSARNMKKSHRKITNGT
jgi:hypothetical protein